MPIYEYRCPKCGEFEVMQRITAATLKKCPRCRRKVTKLISNTSFQLKGEGWYVTDYARKGNGDGANGKDNGAEAGASGTEAKTSTADAPAEPAGAKKAGGKGKDKAAA